MVIGNPVPYIGNSVPYIENSIPYVDLGSNVQHEKYAGLYLFFKDSVDANHYVDVELINGGNYNWSFSSGTLESFSFYGDRFGTIIKLYPGSPITETSMDMVTVQVYVYDSSDKSNLLYQSSFNVNIACFVWDNLNNVWSFTTLFSEVSPNGLTETSTYNTPVEIRATNDGIALSVWGDDENSSAVVEQVMDNANKYITKITANGTVNIVFNKVMDGMFSMFTAPGSYAVTLLRMENVDSFEVGYANTNESKFVISDEFKFGSGGGSGEYLIAISSGINKPSVLKFTNGVVYIVYASWVAVIS